MPLTELDVSTRLFCEMSMRVEPDGPTVEPEFVVADAPVKVTVPKLANGTSALLDSKSSTIHSALVSHRRFDCALKLCETDLPVVRFSILTLPAEVEVAVAVMRMELPAEMAKPEKV